MHNLQYQKRDKTRQAKTEKLIDKWQRDLLYCQYHKQTNEAIIDKETSIVLIGIEIDVRS